MKGGAKVVCRGGGVMMPMGEISLEAIQDHLGRYAFAVEFVQEKVVLDVACGAGYGSAYLFDKGARMVVGGDLSAEAIEVARVSCGRPGVDFLLLDATRFPFADDSFEAIVSMETIEHLEQYEDFLSECERVLKGGGAFVCSTPNKGHGIPEITKFGPDHIHELCLEEFQKLLSRFFAGTQIYAQGYWRNVEGARTRTKLKVMNAINHLVSPYPKLYQVARCFYWNFYWSHTPHMRLSQIENFDEVLSEKHKPSSLVNSSLIPKTIIAVARKQS